MISRFSTAFFDWEESEKYMKLKLKFNEIACLSPNPPV